MTNYQHYRHVSVTVMSALASRCQALGITASAQTPALTGRPEPAEGTHPHPTLARLGLRLCRAARTQAARPIAAAIGAGRSARTSRRRTTPCHQPGPRWGD